MYLHFYNKDFGEFSKKIKNIHIIYGVEQSGKTSLLKYFNDGFSGTERSFLVNGSKVEKDAFNVLNITFNSSLSDMLRLTAKSHLKKELKSHLSDVRESEILELERLEQAFNEIVGLEKLRSIELFSKLGLSLNLDIEMIVEKCMQITFESKDLELLSRTETYFGMIEYLKMRCCEDEKLTIILIDDFGAGLSKVGYQGLLSLLNEFPKHVYFICVKSDSNVNDRDASISFIRHHQILMDCFVDELVLVDENEFGYDISQRLEYIKNTYYIDIVDYITQEITLEEIGNNYIKTVANYIKML